MNTSESKYVDFNIKNKFIVGACCSVGQKKSGTDHAPISILHESKYDEIIPSKMFDNYTGFQKLYDVIYSHNIKSDDFILTVGGDHSIACSSISAIYDSFIHKNDPNFDDLIIIWIDAHGDINTYDSSVTKNIHGMPVAFLLGLCDQNLVKMSRHIKPKNLIYIGLRDLDPPELKFLNDLNIKYYTNIDVKTKSIETIMIEIYPLLKNKYIHVSLDVDSLDPTVIPSTGTPVDDGLTEYDVLHIISSLKSSNFKSLDIVEFNPKIGSESDVKTTLNFINKLLNYF